VPIYLRLILLTGPVADVEVSAPARAAQIEALRGAGKLLATGTMRDGEGYVDVLRVADLHEAEKLAREDALIAGGLGTWVLRELERFET
jgi:hypothetical protein